MQKTKRKERPDRKRKVNRKVKDRLFRFLFEKDKEALLQLHNALNGTDYSNVPTGVDDRECHIYCDKKRPCFCDCRDIKPL